jgi:hypothetical protein
MKSPRDRAGEVLQTTERWLERAVIGLNLCPFAKAVHVKGQIHYALTWSQETADVLDDLTVALHDLLAQDPQQRDTTLLIAPNAFPDFWDFHGFVKRADKLLRSLRLDSALQIASFHPQYEFAQTPAGDMAHYTNRAPYPILHLLREDSMDRAVAAYPDAALIYERNIARLHDLGAAGWLALDVAAPAKIVERSP